MVLEYHWNGVGIPLGFLIPLEYRWNIVVIMLEYRWDTVGIPLGWCWSGFFVKASIVFFFCLEASNKKGDISNFCLLMIVPLGRKTYIF